MTTVPVDGAAVDPEDVAAVAGWRRDQRKALLDQRKLLAADTRAGIEAGLTRQLSDFLAGRLVPGQVISFYWPIKGEPDLRPLMRRLHDEGLRIALPLVETEAAPLTFRAWTPETRLVRGHWNILVPPSEAPEIRPEVTLAPLVGWDAAGFRLGYGGGYFDRTLASVDPRPLAIGVGLDQARIATIHPQSHDIRMDAVITQTQTRSA